MSEAHAMRAVLAEAFGPPDSFSIRTVDSPVPGPGELRIRVQAAGVSFVDRLAAAGLYQVKPALPFIPGSECTGIVDRVGEGVSGFAVGDRVIGSDYQGAFAERAVLPVIKTMRIGPAMPVEQAAVAMVPQLTALHALVDRGQLRTGERVVVLGAAGAVGLAAIQVASLLGASVLAVASTEAKRAAALSAGAVEAVDGAADDFRAQVARFSAGGGADIIVDPVGGDVTEKAFRSLGPGGRHLVLGFASGAIPALRTNLALVKTASLVGVDVGQFLAREPERAAEHHATLRGWWEQGLLRAPIGAILPFERFAEAMDLAASRENIGRVVLMIQPENSHSV